jgi:RND family efflux transporter MFP subunit
MRVRSLGAAAALASLLLPALAGAQPKTLMLSEEARRNLRIETAPAQLQEIHEVQEVRGMLREQADRLAYVTPPVRGRIAEVRSKIADKVRKGDVLLTLYCPELEKLRTDLALGAQRVALLEQDLERARALVERRVLAERDLLRAQTELALARSQAEAARRSILLMGMTEAEIQGLLADPARPAFLLVHAPISGSITSREAYLGEMVEPSRRLFGIMDTSVLWAEADVFERDVPRIAVGQEVSLALRAFEGITASGVIRAISADLHPSKRTGHLWIEVPNPTGVLMPQMAVDLSIFLGVAARVLAVPVEAVLEEGGESFVFAMNGDAFLRQPVVLGVRDNRFCEVKEGLYEGDKVVTRGNHELRLALAAEGQPAALHTH